MKHLLKFLLQIMLSVEQDEKDNLILGPTLTAEKDDVDPGSLVWIVSIDFLKVALADMNKETVSKEDALKVSWDPNHQNLEFRRRYYHYTESWNR